MNEKGNHMKTKTLLRLSVLCGTVAALAAVAAADTPDNMLTLGEVGVPAFGASGYAAPRVLFMDTAAGVSVTSQKIVTPDGDWELQGYSVGRTLSARIHSVANVTTSTRWPWDGKIDVACDLTGEGKVQLEVALTTNGVTVCKATAAHLAGATEIDLGEAQGATNGVKLVWDAKADCPADFYSTDAKVKVTVKNGTQPASGESWAFAFGVREAVALATGETTIADVSWSATLWGKVDETFTTVG